jgi:hypothetical protein
VNNRTHGFATVIGLAALLSGLPAVAAPTCQTANGETIKCGIAGAMPVGWRLPAEQYRVQSSSELFKWLQAICAVGVLFAIMAAMPDFDSTHPGGWDGEEEDNTRFRP